MPSAPLPQPVHREGPVAQLLAGLVSSATTLLDDGAARVVVGLTGAPGSGKSTLADALAGRLAELGRLAGHVPMDGFHMSNAVLDELGRHGRKGAPDTFDVDGYVALLDRVRGPVRGAEPGPGREATAGAGAGCALGPEETGGEPPEVLAPVYRRDLHEPVAAGTRVTGRGVVVTEGNYLALDGLGWEAVRPRIDILVHLEVPEPVLIERLIDRHQRFGRDAVDAAHWVRAVDVPNARLVAGTAGLCDEIWHLAETADGGTTPTLEA